MKAPHRCPECGVNVRITAHHTVLDPDPHPNGTIVVERWAEEPQVKDYGDPASVPRSEPLRYRSHQCSRPTRVDEH